MIELNIENLAKAVRGHQATDWMLPLFWALTLQYPGCRVGEIGFRGGTSALAWLLGVREVGGYLYSMDIEECWPGRNNIDAAKFTDYFTFIHGDSREVDFPEPLDILFIDGDHSAEGVAADYERHRANVKAGGVVLFHDSVECEGVRDFVRDRGFANIAIGHGLAVEVA